MSNDKETLPAVVKKFNDRFPAMCPKVDIIGMLQEELGDIPLTPRDVFPMYTFPTGTGTQFELSDGMGDKEYTKTISGVILHAGTYRAYHPEPLESGNKIPLCSSNNGVVGNGQPGGECLKCPLDSFGSAALKVNSHGRIVNGMDSVVDHDTGQPIAEYNTDVKIKKVDGKGKACTEYRMLYLLMEGIERPVILRVPPTSLTTVKMFIKKVVSEGSPKHGVVTEFSLKAAGNHAELVCKIEEKLSDHALLKTLGEAKHSVIALVNGEKLSF